MKLSTRTSAPSLFLTATQDDTIFYISPASLASLLSQPLLSSSYHGHTFSPPNLLVPAVRSTRPRFVTSTRHLGVASGASLDVIVASEYGRNTILYYHVIDDDTGHLPPVEFDRPHVLSGEINDRPSSVACGDVTLDGRSDCVAASLGTNSITLYTQSVTGQFEARTLTKTLRGADDVQLVDLDGDLDLDVLVGGRSDAPGVFRNNNGKLATTRTILDNTIAGTVAVRVADMDGDLDVDICVVSASGALHVLFNTDGLGTFGPLPSPPVRTCPQGLANDMVLVDADADGDVDCILACANSIVLLRNDGSGHFPAADDLFIDPLQGATTIDTIASEDGVHIVAASSFNATLSLYRSLIQFVRPEQLALTPGNYTSVPRTTTSVWFDLPEQPDWTACGSRGDLVLCDGARCGSLSLEHITISGSRVTVEDLQLQERARYVLAIPEAVACSAAGRMVVRSFPWYFSTSPLDVTRYSPVSLSFISATQPTPVSVHTSLPLVPTRDTWQNGVRFLDLSTGETVPLESLALEAGGMTLALRVQAEPGHVITLIIDDDVFVDFAGLESKAYVLQGEGDFPLQVLRLHPEMLAVVEPEEAREFVVDVNQNVFLTDQGIILFSDVSTPGGHHTLEFRPGQGSDCVSLSVDPLPGTPLTQGRIRLAVAEGCLAAGVVYSVDFRHDVFESARSERLEELEELVAWRVGLTPQPEPRIIMHTPHGFSQPTDPFSVGRVSSNRRVYSIYFDRAFELGDGDVWVVDRILNQTWSRSAGSLVLRQPADDLSVLEIESKVPGEIFSRMGQRTMYLAAGVALNPLTKLGSARFDGAYRMQEMDAPAFDQHVGLGQYDIAVEFVLASDLSGDGVYFRDVLVGTAHELHVLENDGLGEFAAVRVASQGDLPAMLSACTIDTNDNQRNDILIGTEDGVWAMLAVPGVDQVAFSKPQRVLDCADARSIKAVKLDPLNSELISVLYVCGQTVSVAVLKGHSLEVLRSTQLKQEDLQINEVFAADLDLHEDGQVEVVVAGRRTITAFYPSANGSEFRSERVTGDRRALADWSAAACHLRESVRFPDLVAGNALTDEIFVFENLGHGWERPRRVVSGSGSTFVCADLDSDGDLDLLVAAAHDGEVFWLANDAYGYFTRPVLITAGSFVTVSHLLAVDLSGDVEVDVVLVLQDDTRQSLGEMTQVSVLVNSYGDLAYTVEYRLPRVVGRGEELTDAVAVFAADIDGLGGMDLVVATDRSHMVVWFPKRYDDGSGAFGEYRLISDELEAPAALTVAPFFGTSMDVLVGAASGVVLFINEGPELLFSRRRSIVLDAALHFSGCRSVAALDLDFDGITDAVAVYEVESGLVWWRGNGAGGFHPATVLVDGSSVPHVNRFCWADFAQLGSFSLVFSSNRGDLFYLPPVTGATCPGLPMRKAEPVRLPTLAGNVDVTAMTSADMTGNGVFDIVLTSGRQHALFVLRGDGVDEQCVPRFTQKLVSSRLSNPRAVFVTDANDDGLGDIFVASADDGLVMVFVNQGGLAFEAQVVASEQHGAWSLFAVDMGGDLDADVAVAARSLNHVHWVPGMTLASSGVLDVLVRPCADGEGDCSTSLERRAKELSEALPRRSVLQFDPRSEKHVYWLRHPLVLASSALGELVVSIPPGGVDLHCNLTDAVNLRACVTLHGKVTFSGGALRVSGAGDGVPYSYNLVSLVSADVSRVVPKGLACRHFVPACPMLRRPVADSASYLRVYESDAEAVNFVLANHTSVRNGSCLAVQRGSRVDLQHVVVRNCHVPVLSGFGGGVFVDGSAKFRLRKALLTECSALEGGGLYVENSVATMLSDIVVSSCFAMSRGGGAVLRGSQGGTQRIDLGTALFVDNRAARCGGLKVDRAAIFAMADADIQFVRNVALSQSGGGMCVTLSQASLTDAKRIEFLSNSARFSAGGGLYVLRSSIELSGRVGDPVLFSRNVAAEGGSFLGDSSEVAVSDVRVLYSLATGPAGGGGVTVTNCKPAFFTRVEVASSWARTGYGGGFSCVGTENRGTAELALFDSHVAHNRALRGGGGVAVQQCGVWMVDVVVDDNHVMNPPGTFMYGGGLMAMGDDVVWVERSTVTRNMVHFGSGGGIASLTSVRGVLLMEGTNVTENFVPQGGGGGVYYAGEPPTLWSEQAVRENVALFSDQLSTPVRAVRIVGNTLSTMEQTSREELRGSVWVELVDGFGNRMMSDNVTELELRSDSANVSLIGVAVVRVKAHRGLAVFEFGPGGELLEAEGSPGSSGELVVLVEREDEALSTTLELRFRSCHPGEVVSSEPFCEQCSAGRYSRGLALKECHECAPNTFANETGSSECAWCPIPRYAVAGQSSCATCEPGKYLAYSSKAPHLRRQCEECPAHATCLGSGAVDNNAGWWVGRVERSDGLMYSELHSCTVARCKEGRQCGEHRREFDSNVLCGECEEGYYEWHERCTACSVRPGIIVGLLLGSQLLILVYHLLSRRASSDLNIVISFAQVAFLVTANPTQESSTGGLFMQDVVNFRFATFGKTCFVPLSGQWLLWFPLVAVLVLFAQWALFAAAGWLWCWWKEKAFELSHFVRTLVALWLLTFLGVAGSLLDVLNCVHVHSEGETRHVVAKFPALSCSSDEYRSSYALAIALAVLWFAVMPVGGLVWLYVSRGKGEEVTGYAVIKMLTEPFKDERWYWNGTLLMRRLALQFVAVFLSTSRQVTRAGMFVMLNLLFLVWQVLSRPYKSSSSMVELGDRGRDRLIRRWRGSDVLELRSIHGDGDDAGGDDGRYSARVVLYRLTRLNDLESMCLFVLTVLAVLSSMGASELGEQPPGYVTVLVGVLTYGPITVLLPFVVVRRIAKVRRLMERCWGVYIGGKERAVELAEPLLGEEEEE